MRIDIIEQLVSYGLLHITDRIINNYLINVYDICHFEQVSPTWNSLVLDHVHWKYKYDRQYEIKEEENQDIRD